MQEPKNKKVFKFTLRNAQKPVEFSSNFDSGNLASVDQISEYEYRISGEPDKPKPYAKNWFYFSIKGFPLHVNIKITIANMNILAKYWIEDTQRDTKKPLYQICYRTSQHEQWQRYKQSTRLDQNRLEQMQLSFCYKFVKNCASEFAFCFPYSYQKLNNYLAVLGNKYKNDQHIELKQEILTVSDQGRNVYLLTINSRNHQSKQAEQYFGEDNNLFPHRKLQTRPFKHNYKKNCILITARVHPAETPASYTLQGILQFLLDKIDLRSYILRQLFTIYIIPMINPDGVANGNFRTDNRGQNLNRYYHLADPKQQRIVFAVKSLVERLTVDQRLLCYFDLHAHNSPKGCFIYGNFMEQLQKQVEAKTYSKVMAYNQRNFEYQLSNFSKKQMAAKDKNDIYSKEGCSRVQVHKMAGICHSYTIECGYYNCPEYADFDITNKDFTYNSYGYHNQSIKNEDGIFTIDKYKQIGKHLMITVLDCLQLNPYSKLDNTQLKTIDNIRKKVAQDVFQDQERVKKYQTNMYWKSKNVSPLIEDMYASFRANIHLDKIFINYKLIKWPACMRMGIAPVKNSDQKSNRSDSNSSKIKPSNSKDKKLTLTQKNISNSKPKTIVKTQKQKQKQKQKTQQPQGAQTNFVRGSTSSDCMQMTHTKIVFNPLAKKSPPHFVIKKHSMPSQKDMTKIRLVENNIPQFATTKDSMQTSTIKSSNSKNLPLDISISKRPKISRTDSKNHEPKSIPIEDLLNAERRTQRLRMQQNNSNNTIQLVKLLKLPKIETLKSAKMRILNDLHK